MMPDRRFAFAEPLLEQSVVGRAGCGERAFRSLLLVPLLLLAAVLWRSPGHPDDAEALATVRPQPAKGWQPARPTRFRRSTQLAGASKFTEPTQEFEVAEGRGEPDIMPSGSVRTLISRRAAMASAPLAWELATGGMAHAETTKGAVSMVVNVDKSVAVRKGTEPERWLADAQGVPVEGRGRPAPWSDTLRFEVDNGDRAPLASARVLAIAKGLPEGGGSYRGAIVDTVDKAYVRFGQRPLGDRGGEAGFRAADALAGGLYGDGVIPEIDMSQGISNFDVLLVAPVKLEGDVPNAVDEKVTFINGKLVTVKSQAKGAKDKPNGSALVFVIDAQELPDDVRRRAVRVGRVTDEGSKQVLRDLSELRAFESESPYFQIAKNAGDGRAFQAQKSFGKPLSRVKVSDVECQV
eukprot:gnl/TRDRNA2_/TRDRNA2_169190_c0_seq1.p1 gnl/TRDRNA2_/TRDRNA2_169190_c0~~gnl/TRDRNA2_/TRDRNA2_169190_c0_seq1.p1  ORF type:complete len:408 (+),score=62.80 gnl/TRDRNA2_/TRDRNA2_169190_c0_seq1:63-1286(+)